MPAIVAHSRVEQKATYRFNECPSMSVIAKPAQQNSQPNSLLLELTAQIKQQVSYAELIATQLPNLPLKLWLISPDNMQQGFTSEETESLLNNPPYWCFCWASGLALAQWILANAELIKGKTVIDVGSGSGIVALAAKLVGAKQVVACDLDPIALKAAQANAALNNLKINFSDDLFTETTSYDFLFAADVLYDQENWPLLDLFPRFAKQVLIADSRQRNFQHSLYIKSHILYAETLPDLAEPEEFRQVSLYQKR